ncbi:MAG TPA: ComEC/Rec2 family competence protein [Terriglobia bacterium]|nr:ComEC/Rec2 family competence protein [Terriglobia bacterium]
MKSPLLILAACFALGILAARALAPGFDEIWLLLAAASACLLVGLVSLRQFWIPLSACMALAGFVLAGLAAGTAFQYRFSPNDIHNLADWGAELKSDVPTEGVIAVNPIRGDNSLRFELECRMVEIGGRWRKVRGKIQVRLFTPADKQSWASLEALNLRYGDMIRAPVRFEKPYVYRNPGSFDFRWWLEAVNDISWEGNIRKPRVVQKLSKAEVSRFSRLVAGVRSRLLRGIDRLYPSWSPQGRVGAVLKAVLLGDRSSLDSDTVENFRQSGLYHLLVIAGLHVGLLASIIVFFPYRFRVGESWRAACLLMFLGGYSLLVEQRAPTLRATLMIMAYVLARYVYRDRSALNAVGLAALILLFHRPAWLFEAGFELSFSAALLIAGLALPILQRTTIPYRNALFRLKELDRDINLAARHAQFRVELRMMIGWLKGRSSWLEKHPEFCEHAVITPLRIVLWAADLVLFSAVLQVGLMMPMAETFHRITIVGIGLNTIAFPLMTVLLALALPTVFLAATLPVLAIIPGKLLFWVTSGLLALTEFRGEPVWMSYRIPGPPLWIDLGFALAVIAAALALSRSRRAFMVSICLFIAFAGLVVSYPFASKIPKGVLEVTALDCGRGEALFTVLPDGTTLLMDAGGREQFGSEVGRWNPGEEIVSPYLWSRGIKKIDIAVLGERSRENVEAMAAIIRNFRVEELWHSPWMPGPDTRALIDAARERGVEIRDLEPDGGEDPGATAIQVLWPRIASRSSQLPLRDRAPVLRVAGPAGSVLLRGNTDGQVGRILAESVNDLSSVVMESSRPLSEIISQKTLVELVKPAVVLQTGGRRKSRQARSFLHLGSRGAVDVPVLTTANEGAITIDIKKSTLEVRCYGTARELEWPRLKDSAESLPGL